jgi:hypothetical protein
MVVYMLSFFLLPKGVLKIFDYFRSRFFWQGDNEKNKYRLSKWTIVCSPKDQGGLGINDLEIENMTLLGKWLFKFITEDEIWQNIIKQKYVASNVLSQVT